MAIRRSALTAAAALVAAAIGACAATPSPPRSGNVSPARSIEEPSLTPPPGGPSAPASSDTVPVASVDAPALAGPDLSCGDPGSAFPAAILGRPPNAELGAGPAADALRRYVREPDVVEQGWPNQGWRVVESSPTRVTYLANGGPSSSWWIATFEPQDQQWLFWEGGACHLQIDLPDGVSFASWRIDPANPPTPDATTIHVLGTEQACANGDPPIGRVLAPIVLPTDKAVTIALVVKHVPGGADCPGNPEFRQEVSLPTPLGTRQLFDGGTVPPAPRT